MASIDIVGLHLHDASDLDDFMILRHATQPRTTDPRVSPVVYADGSLGATVTAGTPRIWEFDIPFVSDALLDELDDRLKRLQMLRSVKRHLRIYGHLVAVTDAPHMVEANTATITFAQTTFAEAS